MRDAEAGDSETLAQLSADAYQAAYAAIVQRSVLREVIATTCSPGAFRAAIARASQQPDEYFFVAEDDGVLVGFLDFGGENEGLELRRLYTRPTATSRGIGAILLSTLEERLAPGTQYRAVVHAANERALSFWERHGLVRVDVIDGREHFSEHRGVDLLQEGSDPEPLVVMERTVGRN